MFSSFLKPSQNFLNIHSLFFNRLLFVNPSVIDQLSSRVSSLLQSSVSIGTMPYIHVPRAMYRAWHIREA
jgi:hypothetical protein